MRPVYTPPDGHQAILDAFHSLLAEGDSRSARGHHDAVRSWLLADPIRVEALLERDWPGVSSLAIGRAFYWRFLQKYRPDLLDRAMVLAGTGTLGQEATAAGKIFNDLIDNTDFVAYPHLARLFSQQISARLNTSEQENSRCRLAGRVMQVSIGDYQPDDTTTAFEHDQQALDDILDDGAVTWEVWENEPRVYRDLVQVLVHTATLSMAVRQTDVLDRFPRVLDRLLRRGATLEGGVRQAAYPRWDRPIKQIAYQLSQATDKLWQDTHRALLGDLLAAGACWKEALEELGEESLAGQIIAHHPVVRRARLGGLAGAGADDEDVHRAL